MMRIACGMSGGVDSSVAAYLLKREGHEVIGVFMRNWEEENEFGECSADLDLQDAHTVCQTLNIKLVEANFVKEYWNYVFSETLNDYISGLTPNPDILCNHHIKFDAFYKYAFHQLHADAIAMGHYARTTFTKQMREYQVSSQVRLLKGVDKCKDQSFFLSRISQTALRRCLFPIGHLHKKNVRHLAEEAGLHHVAIKPDSTGMCFIGKRCFQEFIDQYIEPKSGKFIDIDTGNVCGTHNGIHQWTIGQRCKISGCLKPYYVAHKEVDTQIIYVALGTDHPALYAENMLAADPHWIVGVEPKILTQKESIECDFRFQNTQEVVPCKVEKENGRNSLKITLLNGPLRALTPGQM